MRVALYARYSSEGQRQTSIIDQFRNCETYATHEGWTITHRYEDKAISGTKDETGRPGYKRMLADLEAKVFDVLLIDDMSRLSRDEDEANKTRKRFLYHGARLIAVSDGIDTNHKGHKLQAKAKALTNELFLDQLKEQIKRGMVGQAQRCMWNGGRVYGYRLVPVVDRQNTTATAIRRRSARAWSRSRSKPSGSSGSSSSTRTAARRGTS